MPAGSPARSKAGGQDWRRRGPWGEPEGRPDAERPRDDRPPDSHSCRVHRCRCATGRRPGPSAYCPARAPSNWGLHGPAPLNQVAVLSQPVDQPIDDRSPPSLVPDRGFSQGTVWHNIWLMGDEAGWSHFIECRYRGSDRTPRLPADGLQRCEQTTQPFSKKKPAARSRRWSVIERAPERSPRTDTNVDRLLQRNKTPERVQRKRGSLCEDVLRVRH